MPSDRTQEICAGCGHSLGSHFESVDKHVRCLVTEHGTTTGGVIGLPFTHSCDCVDYVSPKMDRQRGREKREREEREAVYEKIKAAIAAGNIKTYTPATGKEPKQ